MSTYPSYFDDTYTFNDSAKIIKTGKDEQGHFLVLDQTIFYPQGGGQPSDQGTIQVGNTVVPIHSVKSVDHEIRHYTQQDASHLMDQKVLCTLDQERRLLNAKLHTSGHLISNIIEGLYPQWIAVKGHHFPKECYVEFSDKDWLLKNVFIEAINQEMEKLIKQDLSIRRDQVTGDKLQELCPDLPYSVPKDKPIRVVRIGELPFSPCGGTHVNSLKELRGLQITNHKIKKNRMKIYYNINQ